MEELLEMRARQPERPLSLDQRRDIYQDRFAHLMGMIVAAYPMSE
jgi:hypothetical protein